MAISNLITYCLMPAAVFINLYETNIEAKVLLEIIGYLLIFSVSLMIISAILSKAFKFNKKESATLKNSIVLMNSGNYGIPVSQLIFHANPLGISIQIDRKSTRLNSSHVAISYAVFCLKKKTPQP